MGETGLTIGDIDGHEDLGPFSDTIKYLCDALKPEEIENTLIQNLMVTREELRDILYNQETEVVVNDSRNLRCPFCVSSTDNKIKIYLSELYTDVQPGIYFAFVQIAHQVTERLILSKEFLLTINKNRIVQLFLSDIPT
ncbi:MAG: hypothetical protein Fur003_1260 [Candidatus Dojkabacteria bacterium]